MTTKKNAKAASTEPKTTKDLWLEAQAALESAQLAYKAAKEAAACLPAEAVTNPKPEHVALIEAAENAADALSLAEYMEAEADYRNVIEQIRDAKIVFNAAKLSQLMRAEGKGQKIFLAVVRHLAEKAGSQFHTLCAQAGVDHDDPLFLTEANVATRLQTAPAKLSGTLDSADMLEAAYGKGKLTAHRTAAMLHGTIREKTVYRSEAPNDTATSSDIAYLSEVDSLDI